MSRRSHVTGFHPLPTGSTEYESALERDFVTLTSFLDPAARIVSQPVTVRFLTEAGFRRYTPDFLVKRVGAGSELIEIKYENDLRANIERLAPAFDAACAWAANRGVSFRVVTEKDIRRPALKNAQRLLPLRNAPVNLQVTHCALNTVRSQHSLTLRDLLKALPVDRRISLATIWALLARGTLRADFSAAITLDTPIIAP